MKEVKEQVKVQLSQTHLNDMNKMVEMINTKAERNEMLDCLGVKTDISQTQHLRKLNEVIIPFLLRILGATFPDKASDDIANRATQE